MQRSLVVPLDGSELAERALPYAVRIAVASGGRLVLVRVGHQPKAMTRNFAAHARADPLTDDEQAAVEDGTAAVERRAPPPAAPSLPHRPESRGFLGPIRLSS